VAKTKAQGEAVAHRRAAQRERIEQLRSLLEQEPGRPLTWYAERVGVGETSVRRYLKEIELEEVGEHQVACAEQTLGTPEIDVLKQQLEAYAQRVADLEAEKAALEVDPAAKEQELIERADREVANLDQYFRDTLETCGPEVVISDRDEVLVWQGFVQVIRAGVPTEVPRVFAGVLRDTQKARRECEELMRRFVRRE